MDRTTLFNNAGVRFCEARTYQVALDMFQAALEETALFARTTTAQPDDDDDGDDGAVAASSASRVVITAENHLSNIETILLFSFLSTEAEHGARSSSSSTGEASAATAAATTTVGPSNQQGSNSSNRRRPYLYEHPIALRGNCSSMQLIAAIVVFNLGLAHHLRRASSPKARRFYEIAKALIVVMADDNGNYRTHQEITTTTSDDDVLLTILLQVAVTNNLGVWSYENGHNPVASECLHRLESLLHQFEWILPQQFKDGLKSNITRFSSSSSL